MHIFTALKKDHREIKRLCREIKRDAKEGPRKAMRAFRELADLLDAHTHAEENALYERMKDANNKTRESAFEGYEEHHVADLLVNELKRLDNSADRWKAKFEVLKEALEHHIEEEEDEFFKAASKALSKDELEMAGDEFLAEKDGLAGPTRLEREERAIA